MSLSPLPLSYCTNVHPARTVAEVVGGIETVAAEASRQLPFPMAAGLWLSAAVVAELKAAPEQLETIAQSLWQNELTCYTLNTFPFGDFHSERVKEHVYLPDWANPRRVEYTESCAEILAKLLPPGATGSLSSLPLGGRMNPHGDGFHATCFANLIRVARRLKQLHDETGRTIRLALEPEPLCELSGTRAWTLPMFHRLFQQAEALGCEATVREYIGLCFDVCHQAVEFEDCARSVAAIVSAGIRINKIHITSAIELLNPRDNRPGLEQLQTFAEPRYLHQVAARFADGTIRWRTDLSATEFRADDGSDLLDAEAWRVHFHVPVFEEQLGALRTTRGDISSTLTAVDRLDHAPHLEVETYTWPVMPGHDAPASLSDRIAQELQSAAELLATC